MDKFRVEAETLRKLTDSQKYEVEFNKQHIIMLESVIDKERVEYSKLKSYYDALHTKYLRDTNNLFVKNNKLPQIVDNSVVEWLDKELDTNSRESKS